MTTSSILQTISAPASAPVRGWRWWTAMVLLAVMPVTACYSTLPVTGTVPTGGNVVLDISDRGRVALGDRIGPSADQVQGLVQSMNDSAYVLSVTSVRYLGGQTNRWNGETLSISRDLVSRATQREFSRFRTIALGVGLAGAVLGFLFSTDFFGGGSGAENGVPKGGTGAS